MSRETTLRDLSVADRRLIEEAQAASAFAYAPYSGFAVGAAVRTASGKIYAGANLENAAYGVTTDAEASALALANAAGDFDIEAIAVVGHKFSSPVDASQIVTPCGRCHQMIAEASQLAKREVRILCGNGELSKIVETTITELLPRAFGPDNLGLTNTWLKLRDELQRRTRQLIGSRENL